MALTERSRSALYQGLTDLIEDEVAVGELLSYFPARDVEEPATKEFVAAQMAGVHRELAELRGEMSTMGADLRGEMATSRADLRGEMSTLGSDLRGEMAAMEGRIIASSSAQLRTMIRWTVGLQISLIGLVVAMGFLQGP